MKINISGHHVEITEGITTAVENKFQKVGTHYPDINQLAVIVKVDKHIQSVEVSTQYQGASVSTTAADKDMYTAIQLAAKKLESALSKRKGALRADRSEKRSDGIDNTGIESGDASNDSENDHFIAENAEFAL